MNHIKTIARDLNDNIILFDGQFNMAYNYNGVLDYLKIYNFIYLWCSEHKYKDTIDSIQSKKCKIKAKPNVRIPALDMTFELILFKF